MLLSAIEVGLVLVWQVVLQGVVGPQDDPGRGDAEAIVDL